MSNILDQDLIPVDSLQELVDNITFYDAEGSQRPLLESAIRSCRDKGDRTVSNLLERLKIYYLLPESFDYSKAQICSALERVVRSRQAALSSSSSSSSSLAARRRESKRQEAINQGLARVTQIQNALAENRSRRSSSSPRGPLWVKRPLGTPGSNFRRREDVYQPANWEDEYGQVYEIGRNVV